MGHLSGSVPQAVEYTCLKFSKEIWAEVTDLTVISILMVLIYGKGQEHLRRMCSLRRDGAQGRALETSSNYGIGGGKGVHEREMDK